MVKDHTAAQRLHNHELDNCGAWCAYCRSVCARGAQITTGLFSDLDLHKSTHAAISNVLGYANMTQVQDQSIPVCLTGELGHVMQRIAGTV